LKISNVVIKECSFAVDSRSIYYLRQGGCVWRGVYSSVRLSVGNFT